MKHAPTRKLADALFKGQDADHFFKVYPLTGDITDQPAVFIISRRITDHRGRGHQLAVCIGETESTSREIKKHKRAACAKDNAANVVCLLKEKDAKMRRTVIEDLLANRSFSCIRNVYKPKIVVSKSASEKARRTAKSTARSSRSESPGPATSKTGKRVQGRVDRNGRQHRLPNQKRASGRTATRGAPRVSRPGKKAAA